MRKVIISLLFIIVSACEVEAQQLVLSDIIQQARDAQLREEARQKAELAMMKPAASTNKQLHQSSCEQSAQKKSIPKK